MIRRKYDHQRVLILFADMHRCQPHTGRRISANGFTQDIFLWKLRKLLHGKSFIIPVGNDVDIFHIHQRLDSLHCVLNHRHAIIGQTQKLFGQILSAFGPESLSPASCHDHRCYLHTLFPFSMLYIRPTKPSAKIVSYNLDISTSLVPCI